jgi:rhomboid family GlyGly-CTERM serine protease
VKFPVATFVVVAAALVAGFDQSALVYDRAQILSGELWRLITCNWVHFSASHVAYDLLVFGIAGSFIELRRCRGFGSFCMIAPAVIGAMVFISRADVQLFGGLSGLATGAIVFLALHGVRERGAWRCICAAALVAVVAKLAFEFYSAQPLFIGASIVQIRTVPESHLAGAVVAGAVWLKNLKVPLQSTAMGRISTVRTKNRPEKQSPTVCMSSETL